MGSQEVYSEYFFRLQCAFWGDEQGLQSTQLYHTRGFSGLYQPVMVRTVEGSVFLAPVSAERSVCLHNSLQVRCTKGMVRMMRR